MGILYGVSRRSSLHFTIFVIIAVGMTLFTLNEAQKAIAEIEKLRDAPIFLRKIN